MFGESGFAGFGDVLFHAESGQGDGGDAEAMALAKLLDQIDAGAVGQADVAEKQIERLFGGEDGGGDRIGHANAMAEAFQKPAQDSRGVVVVFDQ